ncbi:oxidoreductase [Fundidesulfovibrio agrisoli]|uniref:oxidoreductase n=1 Tax=Fundidesulfovibrio agrisoli TaxID=2922717 RepID=UPI001FAD44CA|nr:oxidoreductase [Fundidesulfovibrio agrisoli]
MMLKDKTVVVLGGAGLLGRRIVAAVLGEGGNAAIADFDLARAEAVAAEFPADKISCHQVDMTSATSLDEAVAQVTGLRGRIDALVCTAYPRNKNYGRKLEDVTYADFSENVSLHLGGYFLAAQRFSLAFKAQGGGNVVFLSSIYGVMAPRFEIYDGTPMTMPVEYAAIKAALQHLAKYFAKYFRGNGIRYNCLSPGGILDAQPEAFLAAYNRHGMSKGMLDPDDIMGTIVYLLSDASAYVNGQNIVVDDGWTL